MDMISNLAFLLRFRILSFNKQLLTKYLYIGVLNVEVKNKMLLGEVFLFFLGVY
jgi:hypothetical protein